MRTLILDCPLICYIQRFAFGDDLSWRDAQTGIMWGFFNALMRLSKEFETNKFIFAWDGRKLYREDSYPEYKANRPLPATEVELNTQKSVRHQFAMLEKELLPALGFQNVFSIPKYEADDIIAVVVLDYVWGETEELPVVVSTDKDMYQLLDHCDILRPLSGDKREFVTKDSLLEKYGVTPVQWLEARTLMGDTSDNLSGIAGVGEKTALKYVLGELPVGKALASITSGDGIEIRARNMGLMILPLQDPRLSVSLRPETGLSFDYFLTMCDRYGFRSFLKTAALEEWRERFNLE